MNKLLFFFMFLAFNQIYVSAFTPETPAQNVKGTVINSRNQQFIQGVTIQIPELQTGAYSKSNGDFIIKDVPVGRYTVRFSAVGFEPRLMNIVVTSGKEVILNVELNETSVTTETITVTGSKGSFVPINESVVVSATEFSVDDAQRFAGSRMDPARMAQNFAGVLGANDSRNDIIIRGGSPTELLWRIDGIDVPNPNHFATQGATGGPVSALNTVMLDNSDFLTGAFPADYIDKMSGVFDLRTRRGNSDRYEFMGQFGFNGFELGAEGPYGFSNSSFIFNYRYSFLGLLEKMGIDFGFAGIPMYQDASFKSDFTLSANHRLSLTALWGTSDINIKESETDSVFTGDFDIKNGTDLFLVGVNLTSLFNDKTYGRLTIGTTFSKYRTELDSITTDFNNNVTDITKWFKISSLEGYHLAKYTLFYSPHQTHNLSIGFEGRYRYYSLDGERFTPLSENGNYYPSGVDGNMWHTLGFVNWNWKPMPKLMTNLGFATQYLELNGKATIEPRLGLSYRLSELQTLSFGIGLHRQSQPLIIYYGDEANKHLDFNQSVHYVLGYSMQITSSSIFKLEGYYKDISKAPVEMKESSFSLLNSGANFGAVFGNKLQSTGTGRTYGAEISFIKQFSDGYYVTATGTIVRQEYTGSDGIKRWGAFDNRFIANLLAGYEWKISPSFAIEFAGRYTIAGGAPYSPVDIERSRINNTTYFSDKDAFSLRMPNYSRIDLRIDFRNNFENFSLISYLSFENILNHNNVLMYIYDAKNVSTKTLYQLGTFFVGGFKIEF